MFPVRIFIIGRNKDLACIYREAPGKLVIQPTFIKI